jgi:hypothetical protein
MKKLPHRYRLFVFALFMSSCTAFVVSGVMAYIHAPTRELFYKNWLDSFSLAWPLVFLSIIVIGPALGKFINLFVEQK